MGYFDNPPHIGRNPLTLEPEGALVEFLTRVIEPEMGVTFRFVRHPLARILYSLEQGEIDAAALFGKTAERASRFDYPEQAFFDMQPVIVVNNRHAMNVISSAEQLRHKKISYTVGAIVSPFMQASDIELNRISGDDTLLRNLNMLALGRIEMAYWPDRDAVLFAQNQAGLTRFLKILTLPEPALPLFTIFSPKKRDQHWQKNYDQAFSRVGGKDKYAALLTTYLGNDQ